MARLDDAAFSNEGVTLCLLTAMSLPAPLGLVALTKSIDGRLDAATT